MPVPRVLETHLPVRHAPAWVESPIGTPTRVATRVRARSANYPVAGNPLTKPCFCTRRCTPVGVQRCTTSAHIRDTTWRRHGVRYAPTREVTASTVTVLTASSMR